MAIPQPFSINRIIKWPTHLTVNADVDLTMRRSDGYLHFLEAMLFDCQDLPVEGELSVWSRVPPEEATYLVHSVAMATHPLRMAVADAQCMRQVPSEIDGSDTAVPSLPNVIPWISGCAVLDTTTASRKEGTLVGKTYLGKQLGWARFKVEAALEDVPRFANWTLPAPRSLIGFEGVLRSVDEEGMPSIYLRRISHIGDAPRALLQELGVGKSPGTDRAAMRAGRRQASRVKRNRSDDDNDDDLDKSTNSTQPSTPPRSPSKVRIIGNISPVKAMKSPVKVTPPSPTPGLLTRKRSRAEMA